MIDLPTPGSGSAELFGHAGYSYPGNQPGFLWGHARLGESKITVGR